MRIPGYAYTRASVSEVLLGPKTVSVFSIRKAFTPPLPAPGNSWNSAPVLKGCPEWAHLCPAPVSSQSWH